MSVNYPVSLLTSRLQLVANAIDAGPSSGFMQLLDSGNGVLSTMQLAKPAATVANGLLSFNGLALVDPAATGSGFATRARFTDSVGTIVISGLVVGTAAPGSTSQDIFMSPTNLIAAGQTIAVTAATIQGN